MKLRISYRLCYILLFLFFLNTVECYSQSFKEFELEGNMLSTDLDDGGDLSFGVAGKYIYWFNSYVGLTMGGMMNYSTIDIRFQSPVDSKVYYDLDEPVFNLQGTVGFRLSTPTYKKMGLTTGANFVFDPIPYNLVGIDKNIKQPDGAYPKEKSKTRMVYTRFNPSYNIEFSLFYENKTKYGKARIALGGAITNYNPFNPYYHAKIDGFRLRDCAKLRPDEVSYMIFIRISG